jgi:hypothetical protein
MSSMMSVNPDAQRSLARGAGKESTKELLDDDRAHRTPRMRELVGFCLRVMESVEQGDNRQGFLGAVQLVIPDRFTGARLQFVEEMGLSGDAAVAMNALGLRRLAMLEADPDLGETLFEIGDGQGRCFAFYSFQRAVTDALRDRRRRASVKGDAAAPSALSSCARTGAASRGRSARCGSRSVTGGKADGVTHAARGSNLLLFEALRLQH